MLLKDHVLVMLICKDALLTLLLELFSSQARGFLPIGRLLVKAVFE